VLSCCPAGRATFVASWRTFNARACWTARCARRSCSRTRRPRQRSSAVAHPAVERTMHDGDGPLEDSVRDGGPATAGAPSTGLPVVMLRRHVASSGQSAAAGSSAAARGPRLHERASWVKITATKTEKQNVRVLNSEDVAQRAFWESTSQLKKRDYEQKDPFGTGPELRSDEEWNEITPYLHQ